MTSPPAFIHIRQLDKSYDRPGESLEVLKGLDLDVKKGESVAIVGASGVGKSTLLQIAGTLDRPSGGRVLLDGQDVFAMSEPELAGFRNRHIGFVFQFHHLLPEFSALENVMMPALIAKLDKARARKMAQALIDEVGLAGRASHRTGELSGGEQQRVAVARALVMNPQILIADEPTGNLDEATASKVHELFAQLNQSKGLTVLMATHNERLAGLLDRRVRLAKGKALPEM